MIIYRLFITFLIIFSSLNIVRAQTPEDRGKEIAVEADRRDLGWHDNKSVSKMILRNKHGQKSIRELRRFVFEINETGLGDKSLVIFDSPKPRIV